MDLHAIHIVASVTLDLSQSQPSSQRSAFRLIAWRSPLRGHRGTCYSVGCSSLDLHPVGCGFSGLPSCQGTLLWRPCGLCAACRDCTDDLSRACERSLVAELKRLSGMVCPILSRCSLSFPACRQQTCSCRVSHPIRLGCGLPLRKPSWRLSHR